MDTNHKSVGLKSDMQVKPEPGNVVKTERLSSFKMPRDLTLGAGRTLKTNPNKKVYTPNLNVVRTKNSDIQTSRDTSGRGRGAKNTRGGGRGAKTDNKRGSSNVVQTSGVFSEGIAGNVIRRSSSTGGGFGSTRDSASDILRKPALIKRDLIKLDPAVEEQQIREILGDDDTDSYEVKSSESDNMPIKLMDPTKPKNKLELKTKQERLVNGLLKWVDTDETEDFKIDPSASSSEGYPFTADDFFARRQIQMCMLQLPDCLPGRGPEKEVVPAHKPSTSSIALKNEEIVNPPETKKPASSSMCCLDSLQEGQIGKLVRYKSGRTKLILGDTHYDIDLGMEAGFLQDIMSIDTNREQRNGDMIKLGEIHAKINATPDWEHLFSKATT